MPMSIKYLPNVLIKELHAEVVKDICAEASTEKYFTRFIYILSVRIK